MADRFIVSNAMVNAALLSRGQDQHVHDMRAAITAAIEASGLVERIAELETALMGLTDCLHVNVRMTGPTYSIVNGTRFQNAVTKALEALNKEPTL